MPARNTMRVLIPACVLLMGAVLAPVSASAQVAGLRATLILASDDPAAQDPRLDRVEFRLRRIFHFPYYRHYGDGAAAVNLPGEATLRLGHGNDLQIHATDAKDGRVRAQVRWLRDGNLVLNTTVVMSRGTPVILGGVSQAGGTLIVTLVAE
jgi:hypothetical protein